MGRAFYTTLWQLYSIAKLYSFLFCYGIKENSRASAEEHPVLYRRICIISLKRKTEELCETHATGEDKHSGKAEK